MTSNESPILDLQLKRRRIRKTKGYILCELEINQEEMEVDTKKTLESKMRETKAQWLVRNSFSHSALLLRFPVFQTHHNDSV